MSYELFLSDCTGVILAGGENRRMPFPKAFIEVNGEKIIERNLRIMRRLFSEVFIVTNRPEAYVHLNTLMSGDIYDLRGPMTGIYTALTNSSRRWVFISACDMPFINQELIIRNASERDGYDAVVPAGTRTPEPLFAFYSRRLLSSMEERILSGRRGLKDFLKSKRVKYIKKSEIKRIDPEERSFINLNTPEDIDTFLN